jgi:hypothetical protein
MEEGERVSRHALLVKSLSDRLKQLDVRELAYFHTDHFEPWRAVGGAPAVGPEVVDGVHEFCRATQGIDFARRLTLFYKPHLNYALRTGDELMRAHPDDLVGFLPRSPHEESCGRAAMQAVAESTAHDVQLHIHHEYYTSTTSHTDPQTVSWFSSPLGHGLDGQRFELAIGLNRDIIARETARRDERWFFVHGQWALNASDDTSCTITDEIALLMRNGCRGDFTFPAGRRQTNPRIKVPYLCRPFARPKGYDHPAAEPEVACGNARSARDKFFIWSSSASSIQCSLDYMSESSRRQLENTAKAAHDLVDNAYVADGRLYVKTHSHSMHAYYFEHVRRPVFPHQYPATQTLLSIIFDAATRAGVDVSFRTAPEVYDQLLAAPARPDIDLATTYLNPVGRAANRWLGMAWAGRRRPAANAIGDAAEHIHGGQPVEIVRQVTSNVLCSRIDMLGIRESGAYEHYGDLLRRGFPIPNHDLLALDLVRRRLPETILCHEIGSGIGILPFLLALSGYPAVGIECDKRRYDTAMAIRRALARSIPKFGARCTFALGRFPAAAPKVAGREAAALLTDFVTTQSAEQIGEIMNGLRAYSYVVLDLQRFCVVRAETARQQDLLREFQENGFTLMGDVAGSDCALAVLRNDSVTPGVPRLWARVAGRRRG